MQVKRLFFIAIALMLFLTNASANDKWIKVVNELSNGSIWRVYITTAGETSWGNDQLGGNVIGNGDSYTWTIPWRGCYVDVKAETRSGRYAERFNVNICGGKTWTIYD